MKTDSDPMNFAEMGIGYSLYFWTTKFVIWALIMPLSFYALFFLWNNYLGDDCHNSHTVDLARKAILKINPADYFTNEKHQLMTGDFSDLDTFSRKVTQSTWGLNFFMRTYCFSKQVFGDEYCDKYEGENCPSNFTQNCSKYSLEKYSSIFNLRVCTTGIFNVLTLGNMLGHDNITVSSLYSTRSLLNFGCVLFLILFFTYLTFKIEQQAILFDNKILSVSDYTIKLVNLPRATKAAGGRIVEDGDDDESLVDLIKHTLEKSEGVQVRQVNIAYDVEPFLELQKKFNKLVIKKEKREFEEHKSSENNTINQEGEALLGENDDEEIEKIRAQMNDM